MLDFEHENRRMLNSIQRMTAPFRANRLLEDRPEADSEPTTHRLSQFSTPILVAALSFLAACGTQSFTPPAITVTFTPGFTPPTAMTVSEQCGVAATVANDTKNQGVKWTAGCGSASCGTFTPTADSASTIPITYTSPSAIPSGNTVTLTATSITDPTKSVASSPITIGATSSGCTVP